MLNCRSFAVFSRWAMHITSSGLGYQAGLGVGQGGGGSQVP
jgi:hypothetical protein